MHSKYQSPPPILQHRESKILPCAAWVLGFNHIRVAGAKCMPPSAPSTRISLSLDFYTPCLATIGM